MSTLENKVTVLELVRYLTSIWCIIAENYSIPFYPIHRIFHFYAEILPRLIRSSKAGIYSFQFEHKSVWLCKTLMAHPNTVLPMSCFCPCLLSPLRSSRQSRRCLAAVIPVRMEEHVWIHSTHITVCVLVTGMWVLYYLLHYGVLIILYYALVVLLVLMNTTWH